MNKMRVGIILCCFLFLSGCSLLPFQKSTSVKQHLYRRIPYKVEGRYRVIDVFYATARKIKGNPKSHKSFSRKMGKETSYGTVEVRIDPNLKIGTMLPRWYKKRGVIGLQDIRPLEDNVFMKELSGAVETSPHNSLLVVVQGYKDNFEYTTIKASYFAYLLDVNTPILLFDWPGDQAVNIRGYLKARYLAKDAGVQLGEFLTRIVREVKPGKLWVEGSSLGSQVVCDAFEHMYKYDDLADAETEIDHVVLSAPDVAEREFDMSFKQEISALSKKLSTYVSSNDQALLLSAIIDGEKKLGRQKLKVKKHEQLAETKDLLYLKSLDPDRIALVDVTPINNASYNHGYYLESPEYFDDLYLRLFGKPPDANRRLYLLKFEDGTDYWLLRGDD